jgi:hypothetical protein
VITDRSVDPATCTVDLTLETETTSKHAFALGQTGTAPPTPTIVTGEEMDDAAGAPNEIELQTAIRNVYPKGLTVTGADTDGATGQITISDHEHDWPGLGTVAVTGTVLLGLDLGATYYPYADLDALGDSSPTYGATEVYGDALNSAAHPFRIFLQQTVTLPAAGGGSSGGGGFGGGYGGGGGPVLP